MSTWIGLMLLSGLTAWLSCVPMGPFVELLSALGIAVVKGAMIAAIFMHLTEQRTANAYVLIAALILVTFFVSLTAADVATRVGSASLYRPPRVDAPR